MLRPSPLALPLGMAVAGLAVLAASLVQPPADREPAGTTGRIVSQDPAVLYVGPDATDGPSGDGVAPGTTVRLRARAADEVQHHADYGGRRWSVVDPDGRVGWLASGDVAVALDAAGASHDAFGAAELHGLALDLDGDGTRERLFAGVTEQVGWDESEATPGRGRPLGSLWLGAEDGPLAPVAGWSGWGEGWRLVDGVRNRHDGAEALLLIAATTFPEAGYGGQVVALWAAGEDGRLERIAEEPVRDPVRGGHNQRHLGYGWRDGRTSWLRRITSSPCEDATIDGDCLTGTLRAFPGDEVVDVPLRGRTAVATSLGDAPEVDAGTPVEILGLRDPSSHHFAAFDRDRLDLRVRLPDGATGWLPATAITLDEPLLATALWGSDEAVDATTWFYTRGVPTGAPGP